MTPVPAPMCQTCSALWSKWPPCMEQSPVMGCEDGCGVYCSLDRP